MIGALRWRAGGSTNGFRMAPHGLRLILCTCLVLTACDRLPDPGGFSAGMTRDAVVARFGEPEGKQTLLRDTEHVWGPIEDFWADVDRGARVEIWTYPVQGGTVELYFVNDSTTVQGTGFAPEGAVF